MILKINVSLRATEGSVVISCDKIVIAMSVAKKQSHKMNFSLFSYEIATSLCSSQRQVNEIAAFLSQ